MTTSIKTCFKCETPKPLTDFYRHPGMADGRLGKCKECTKTDSRAARAARIDHYRAYDRARGSRRSLADTRTYRRHNAVKYRAHNVVNNAIRDGKLHRLPCEACGRDDSHAHHDDYAKPLDVRWLCPPHHQQWHAENGEGANAHDNPEPAVAADGARKSA